MSNLTTAQRLRLYETLGTIAESLPDDRYRRMLLSVWRQPAWNIPYTDRHRHTRAVLRKHLPDLVVDQWRWVLAVLPDEGGWSVLSRWAEDAGYARRSSS